jgi:hypothetical protein
MNYNNELKNNWAKSLRNQRFRVYLIISFIFLVCLLIIFPKFLLFIETRSGVVLNDPILNLFSPVDLTWLIFGIIYLSLISGLVYFAKDPVILLLALNSYSILLVFRIAAMYLLPLEPPVAMIALNDPFVETFGSGALLTKDLFFSGHTATLLLLFHNSRNRYMKFSFLAGTFIVVISVLLQHVHYSIDVFAAPFFAYASYKISLWINDNLNLK